MRGCTVSKMLDSAERRFEIASVRTLVALLKRPVSSLPINALGREPDVRA
jgi:hypothetical protein